MPLTLPPLSRRRFLQGSLAAAAGLALSARTRGADVGFPAADPDRLVLFSDLHIAADPTAVNRNVCMHAHLKLAVEQVLASKLNPSMGFVTGDLAFNTGLAGDYATLLPALAPLREAGLPLHLGLGNHDNFERFRAAFPPARGATDPVASKQVLVVETPRANLFLLDSLDRTNVTPGVLGAAQLAWLGKALDARKDKPAVVLVHHQPDRREQVSGLTDTPAFYETILPRKQVKAVVFGHTHRRSATATAEGVHLINLPAVAYVFEAAEPSGWTDLKLKDNGATFTLHALDKAHPQEGNRYELTWRADA
jgi:Icc protein